MFSHRHLRFAALALVIMGYVAARFWNLTATCLWFDEIFSVHAAEHSWSTLFPFVADDLIHPPLFYVLLKLWINVGGDSLFWLRLFPVTYSVIALVPLLFLCRELKLGIWTQTLTILFLATNGSLMKYSQEVRMYSMLICLSLFSIWLFARYFLRGKSWIALVLINVFLIYTHYFGWFVIASEILAVLLFDRKHIREMAAMLVTNFLCFTPWIYAVWNAEHRGSELSQNIAWMPRPALYELVQFIFDLIEPFYYQASSIDAGSVYRVSVPLLIILIAVITFYFVRPKQVDDERKVGWSLTPFVAFPLLLAFLTSWLLPYSIWGTRHLVIVFAPFFLLLSHAVTRLSFPAFRTAAITLILLLSGYALSIEAARSDPDFSWCKWEPLIISAMNSDPANVYVFEDDVAYHVWYDVRHNGLDSTRVTKVQNLPEIPADPAYFLPRGFDDVRAINFDEITDSKIWIAYRSKAVELKESPLRNFIGKGYHMTSRQVIEANSEFAILIQLEK